MFLISPGVFDKGVRKNKDRFDPNFCAKFPFQLFTQPCRVPHDLRDEVFLGRLIVNSYLTVRDADSSAMRLRLNQENGFSGKYQMIDVSVRRRKVMEIRKRSPSSWSMAPTNSSPLAPRTARRCSLTLRSMRRPTALTSIRAMNGTIRAPNPRFEWKPTDARRIKSAPQISSRINTYF